MDLKNNRITVGELLDHPPAREVLRRRFPMVFRHPVQGAARTVTLEQVIALVGAYIPRRAIQEAVRELEDL